MPRGTDSPPELVMDAPARTFSNPLIIYLFSATLPPNMNPTYPSFEKIQIQATLPLQTFADRKANSKKPTKENFWKTLIEEHLFSS